MTVKTSSQKRKSFFVQLVLSNLLISLTCVAAMTTLLLFIYATNEQTQKQVAFETAAQASVREVTQLLESTENIANNIVFVQQVRPFTYRQHPMMAIELISSLNSMKASNPFITDVYLYFYQDNYIYSSRNSQLITDFVPSTGQDLSVHGSLRNELSTSMRPVYRMHQGQLFIFYPYINNFESEGMIVFSIPAKTVSQLLPVRQDALSATLLLSAGQLLNESMLDDATLAKIDAVLADNDNGQVMSQGTFTSFKDGHEVFGSSLSPEVYYLRIAEDSSILSKLLSPFICILLFLIGAGSVALATWYFARKNYYPVQVLRDSMTTPNVADSAHVYSEFQAFLSGYSGLQENNRELRRELQEKYEMQQMQLLHALLSGNISRYEDINAQALDLGIDLSAACHLLLIIQGEQSLFLEGIRPLMDYRRRYTYSLNGVNDETLYIIGCDDVPDAEALDYINGVERMSVSVPVTNLAQLHDRYIELRVTRLSPSDVQAQTLASTAEVLACYGKLSQCIADALEAKDVYSLQKAVVTLTDALRSSSIPFAAARYLCYEVLYLYYNYLENHLPLNSGRLQSPESLLNEAASDTLQLADTLANETKRLAAQIETQNTSATRKPLEMEAILCYVQQHFVEPSFSLQMVAESFDISPSYLSAYFKEHYGMKMLDYCTLLRMEKAKELLSKDMALLDISQQTGYYNISSFIRRFKQITGTTPGEYKKSLTS